MTATVRPHRTREQMRWITAAKNRAPVVVTVGERRRLATLLAWNIDRRSGTARVEFTASGNRATVPQSTIELVERVVP